MPLMSVVPVQDAEKYLAERAGKRRAASLTVYTQNGMQYYRRTDLDSLFLKENKGTRTRGKIILLQRQTGSARQTEHSCLDEILDAISNTYPLQRRDIDHLGAILCGDASGEALVLGDASPLAKCYVQLLYERARKSANVWPLNDKQIQQTPPDTAAFCEAYSANQEILQLYTQFPRLMRGFIAVVAQYLQQRALQEKNEHVQHPYHWPGRPMWKIAWKQLAEQTNALTLQDPQLQGIIQDPKVCTALKKEYCTLYQYSEKARNLLVEKHTSFARSQATKYSMLSMPFDDRFQDAMLGLMRCTERYDYTMPNTFRTNARWWVRATILKEMDHYSGIKLPFHIGEKLINLSQIEHNLTEKYGESPSTELLIEVAAEKLNVSPKQIEKYLRAASQRRTKSLDMLVDDEKEGRTLHDLIADPSTTVDERADDVLQREKIQVLFSASGLNKRERFVLEQRYFGNEQPTKSEIGRKMGLSRERVRQIEAEALQKLREYAETNMPRTSHQ